MMKYLFQIQGKEHLLKQLWFNLSMAAFGLLATVLILALSGRWIREHMRQMLPFALAIICSCCCFLFVELIKNPVGRMRFRAMHFVEDFPIIPPGIRSVTPGSGWEVWDLTGITSNLFLPGIPFRAPWPIWCFCCRICLRICRPGNGSSCPIWFLSLIRGRWPSSA